MIARAFIYGGAALVVLCALAALAVVGWVGVALISYLRARRRAYLSRVFDPIRNWRGGRP